MDAEAVHQFVKQFFIETDCRILEETACGLHVQLTEEMDKRIMNRPFYWQYVESSGIEPQPARLQLITREHADLKKLPGERIHYGSPRLHQLFQAARSSGSYVCVYEQAEPQPGRQTILTPYLCMNFKVTYSCGRTKEKIHSLGMNLINGAVMSHFAASAGMLQLSGQISPQTFHLPYTIPPLRAAERLHAVIDSLIAADDHSWIEEAEQRKLRDLRVLSYFYEDTEELPPHYETEKQAIQEQYETSITVDVVNGGLFYLHSLRTPGSSE